MEKKFTTEFSAAESRPGFFASLKEQKWAFAVLFVLGAALYGPIVAKMVGDWYHDPNYSHGFLVPLIAAYFVRERWGSLKRAEVRPCNWGLLVICLGLVELILGDMASEFFTRRSSLVVVLAGTVIYFFGIPAFKLTALPICYLLFMVPLPYLIYNKVAFPLKLFVAKYSVLTLHGLGVVVHREGNIIAFPNAVFEVADACSGIRSLMSLLALAVAIAFIWHKGFVKRTILVVSAVPVAIVSNGARVVSTGLLAQHWGSKAAEGFFHEFAGLAVFALAMALLGLVSLVLKKVGK